MEIGPFKSRPDYHQTTRAIVSMNKEAGQISAVTNCFQHDQIVFSMTFIPGEDVEYFSVPGESGFSKNVWKRAESRNDILERDRRAVLGVARGK